MLVVKHRSEGAERLFVAGAGHKKTYLTFSQPSDSVLDGPFFSFVGLTASILTTAALIMLNQKLSPDTISLKVSPLFPIPFSL